MPKSREKGHGVKGSGPPLREIAISAGMGSAVVLALLTVFALVMSAQDIPGGLTAPMVTITLVVGTLAAGYRCGRQLRQNGIVNGALTGGMMYLVLLAISLTVPRNEVGLLALYRKMMADQEYMSFYTLWIITEKEDKHLVGYLYFLGRPSDTEAVELNGFIKPAYRRKGYMTEALNTLRGWAFANKSVTIMLAHPQRDDEIFHGLLRKSGFGHWVEHEHEKSPAVEVWCSEKKTRAMVKVGLLLGLGLGVVAGSAFGISRWITALAGGILGVAVCTVFDVRESRRRYALLKAEQQKP